MKLTDERWAELTNSADEQMTAILGKSARHGFNVDYCSKTGATETVINMIGELESTLRVLKRRLQDSLTVEKPLYNDHNPFQDPPIV